MLYIASPGFPEPPELPEPFEPFEQPGSPIVLALVGVCLLVIVPGLFAVIIAIRRLRHADNPARDAVAGYFRAHDALSPQTGLSADSLREWRRPTTSTPESMAFQAMQLKKLIKKSGGRFWLDEAALDALLNK